jgi:hypothetical protein
VTAPIASNAILRLQQTKRLIHLFKIMTLSWQPAADAWRVSDYPAPVVRNAGAERELTMMRWGIRRHRAPPCTGTKSPAAI